MVFIRDLAHFNRSLDPQGSPKKDYSGLLFILLIVGAVVALFVGSDAVADLGSLPGEDKADKLEAAGTLLRIVDTALFTWGARIFAGICIMSAGWALKEQRFGIAVICVVGALIFGTAPTWVKNIFSISDDTSLFSMMDASIYEVRLAVAKLGSRFYA